MESELCMRCGRELPSGQVFCEDCLTEMERYPVKPGIVVQLPRRTVQVQKPQPRRRHPGITPEEQVKRLKKRVVSLWAALVLASALAGVLCWLHISDVLEDKSSALLPGQNYSSETSSQPGETEE